MKYFLTLFFVFSFFSFFINAEYQFELFSPCGEDYDALDDIPCSG